MSRTKYPDPGLPKWTDETGREVTPEEMAEAMRQYPLYCIRVAEDGKTTIKRVEEPDPRLVEHQNDTGEDVNAGALVTLPNPETWRDRPPLL